ncbi:MFS transporter [Fangia hongkongensis]|uniref:MFS transporter n=1 Tax=Fangia hongkongensis TaxID=270495 RepID=UPI00036C0A53|nr:MFS transporter [Fangia hongkongensis]
MGTHTPSSASKKRTIIYQSKVDASKAIFLTFVAFLFSGFQAAIYGMLSVPLSTHFNISANTIIFFDGFGLWGQILAMATGGLIINKIKAKNTLLLSGVLMIVGSFFSILAPDVYIYTIMVFICNMAIGYTLVSCNYMVMGTVSKEGESEGKLSILNVFFSLGFLISASIVGMILFYSSWQWVFIVIMILFVLFIILLLSLRIDEVVDMHKSRHSCTSQEQNNQKEPFLTLPIILTAIALFCIVYTEQIMNYYNQPHLHYNLGIDMKTVGMLVSTYVFAQLLGRLIFGKFLLPYIKIHRYLIVSALLFAIFLIIYLFTHTLWMLFIVLAVLGLADSCIYPSILGYGMDQLNKVSARATSFLVTVGAIGIPIGTSLSGIIGESFSRQSAMLVGPVMLVILSILIITIHSLRKKT